MTHPDDRIAKFWTTTPGRNAARGAAVRRHHRDLLRHPSASLARCENPTRCPAVPRLRAYCLGGEHARSVDEVKESPRPAQLVLEGVSCAGSPGSASLTSCSARWFIACAW